MDTCISQKSHIRMRFTLDGPAWFAAKIRVIPSTSGKNSQQQLAQKCEKHKWRLASDLKALNFARHQHIYQQASNLEKLDRSDEVDDHHHHDSGNHVDENDDGARGPGGELTTTTTTTRRTKKVVWEPGCIKTKKVTTTRDGIVKVKCFDVIYVRKVVVAGGGDDARGVQQQQQQQRQQRHQQHQTADVNGGGNGNQARHQPRATGMTATEDDASSSWGSFLTHLMEDDDDDDDVVDEGADDAVSTLNDFDLDHDHDVQSRHVRSGVSSSTAISVV